VKALVLDASFALRWCFEDETTTATELMLSALQNQERAARVPGIWRYEMLNGLGKGVTRGRLGRQEALLFWQEIRELPVQIIEVPVDEQLLDLALKHNLSVYDASYLSLAQTQSLPLATVDGKLQLAAHGLAIEVIRP
jgi:predicted nucleic acid-binding protein